VTLHGLHDGVRLRFCVTPHLCDHHGDGDDLHARVSELQLYGLHQSHDGDGHDVHLAILLLRCEFSLEKATRGALLFKL